MFYKGAHFWLKYIHFIFSKFRIFFLISLNLNDRNRSQRITIFLNKNVEKWIYLFTSMIWVSFFCTFNNPFKKKSFLFIFLWFKKNLKIDFDGYYNVKRVNPDRNIFSIRCGTKIYYIYSTEVWSPNFKL